MPDAKPLLRCRVVSDLAGLAALEPAWRALWAKGPDPTVFTGYDWAAASMESFAGSRSFLVLAVFREDELVAVLPLSAEHQALGFLGMPEADINDLVCLPGLEAAAAAVALETVLALPVPWQRCALDYVWEDSVLVRALDDLPARLRARVHLMYRGVAPRAVLPKDDPEAIASVVKKRNELKRERQLGKKGRLEFRFLERHEEIAAGMEHLVRMHAARRESAGDTSVFLRPPIRAFYDALLRRLDPAREVRFFVMELDGQVIACELAFEHPARFLCFKMAYDAAYEHYSPGTVVTRRLAQYAADRGLPVFDHLRGEETFKYRFANTSKRYFTLHVFRRGIRGSTLRALLRLKERAKKSPLLLRLLGRRPSVPAAPPPEDAEERGEPR